MLTKYHFSMASLLLITRKCNIEIVSKEEKYKLLEKKLQEEVGEFLEDKNLEELADVLEIAVGLANALGYMLGC
ncbi:hypothetical protein CLORY_17190 [Clostridium oryzae]|uniref:Uncharacterized protein n=1 Tax=Clostridium oryzae TaxID=1450648 RepID=A0A1V4IRS5_9CLOT|nr:hypothetical protein CLORY_17190 [Clostridium oryzae]